MSHKSQQGKFKDYMWLFVGLYFLLKTIFLLYKNRHLLKSKLEATQAQLKTVVTELESAKGEERQFDIAQLLDAIQQVGGGSSQKRQAKASAKGGGSSSGAKQDSQNSRSPFELNPRQEQVYRVIKDNDESTITDIANSITSVSNRTLRRDMAKLEKLGLIEQVGKTKNTIYKLKK